MQDSEEKSKCNARRSKTQLIKRQVMMSPLLSKSHPHSIKKYIPTVCPDCKGTGYTDLKFECYNCMGEGEI